MHVFAANRAEGPADVGTQVNFAIAAFAILTKRFTGKIYLVSIGVSRRYQENPPVSPFFPCFVRNPLVTREPELPAPERIILSFAVEVFDLQVRERKNMVAAVLCEDCDFVPFRLRDVEGMSKEGVRLIGKRDSQR
jgi:hypothetical protein